MGLRKGSRIIRAHASLGPIYERLLAHVESEILEKVTALHFWVHDIHVCIALPQCKICALLLHVCPVHTRNCSGGCEITIL